VVVSSRGEHLVNVWWLQAAGQVDEAKALLLQEWAWGPKRDECIDRENRIALRLFRRFGFSTDDDAGWQALPDPLVVYRAQDGPGGWCWTPDRERAEHYRRRLPRREVVCREIAKSDALAFLSGECEVVIESEE
jgi:hypothetical protein